MKFGMPESKLPERAASGRSEEATMAVCEICGNDYHMSFQVTAAGHTHTFDSFECAIHALAMQCSHCGCRIVGHGMEADGRFFCCAHCAKRSGNPQMRDRVESGAHPNA
jgi:phage terminase large subunit GpA-like protein